MDITSAILSGLMATGVIQANARKPRDIAIGKFDFVCQVPGHFEAGMQGKNRGYALT